VIRQVVGVDFRDDQRDLREHAERRTVIDDDAAALHGFGGESEGDRAASAEDGEIKAFESFGLGLLDGPFLAAVGDLGAGRTGRGEGAEFRHGEIPLGHERQQFLTDRASHAHDADTICHVLSSS
jgi:hypothetical protein